MSARAAPSPCRAATCPRTTRSPSPGTPAGGHRRRRGFRRTSVRLRQPLAGFEETYRNIIDYIVRITYRIWEDRDVEYIRDTYHDASRVYDDYGLQLGSAKIVDDTYHTTGAFSDIELIADEIVWAGDEKVGFHTSHRTIIRGTNDGPSRYGPATGRKVDVLVFANCVALENQIFLEHVIYNTSSMLNQLGFDIDDMARKARRRSAGWMAAQSDAVWDEQRAAARPHDAAVDRRASCSGFDVDHFARANFEALWNRRDFSGADGCLRTRLRLPRTNGPGIPRHSRLSRDLLEVPLRRVSRS